MSALLCAGAIIGFATGCPIINTQHCGYHENGAENPCPADYVCSVCAVENNGCVPIGQMDTIKESCLELASTSTMTGSTEPTATTMTSVNPTDTGITETTTATSTITTETTTMAVTESSTDMTITTMTSTTETTTPPVDCDENNIEDPECSPQYCLTGGTCGPCTNFPMGTTCASIDDAKPACDAETGVCMECTTQDTSKCPDDKPACDTEIGKCIPCTEHFECTESKACDIETGKCFPEENAVYVLNKNGCVAGDGSPGSPLCLFSDVTITPNKPTVIKILPGSKSPKEIFIPDNSIVAIVAADSQIPVIDGQLNQTPKVSIMGANARVYLSRVNYYQSATSSVLKCSGKSLMWLTDVEVAGDGTLSARAIEASDCRVRVRRSLIRMNGAGIQVSSGGDLRVESSFIVDNKLVQFFPGIEVVGASTANVVYSTVIRNSPANPHSAAKCTGVGGSITFRNSAVIDIAPMLDDGCVTIDGGLVQAVDSQTSENMLWNEWLTLSQDLYVPKQGGPLNGAATWVEGDPKFDFNRDPIPQGPSFAGALQTDP